MLLSQVHRLRALVLLGRFLDMGPWWVLVMMISVVVVLILLMLLLLLLLLLLLVWILDMVP